VPSTKSVFFAIEVGFGVSIFQTAVHGCANSVTSAVYENGLNLLTANDGGAERTDNSSLALGRKLRKAGLEKKQKSPIGSQSGFFGAA